MYCPRVTKLCLQLMNSGYACGKKICSADPYSSNLVGQVNTCLHPNCLKAPFEHMNRIMIYCEMPHCLSLGFLECQLSQGGHFVSYCVPLYIWTQCLLPVQVNINLSLRKHSIFGEKKNSAESRVWQNNKLQWTRITCTSYLMQAACRKISRQTSYSPLNTCRFVKISPDAVFIIENHIC